MDVVIPAIVGAFASVTVAILSAFFSARHQRRILEDAERRLVRETYLNPLRFQVVESHYRISRILRELKASDGKSPLLDVVETSRDLTTKPTTWFHFDGTALTSAAYVSACLFAHVARVRDNLPYLRLTSSLDTKLSELLLRVQIGFLGDYGVYYVLQTSIGHDMQDRANGRLLTFREFCSLLQDPDRQEWLEPLIRFYVDVGRGERVAQVLLLLEALYDLASFIDENVGGGRSIASRAATEREAQARYEELCATGPTELIPTRFG